MQAPMFVIHVLGLSENRGWSLAVG